jgi:hypothetical protein
LERSLLQPPRHGFVPRFFKFEWWYDAQLTPNDHRRNTSFRSLAINTIIHLPTLLSLNY